MEKKTRKPKQNINFRLDPDIIKELKDLAEEFSVSQVSIVEEALRARFKKAKTDRAFRAVAKIVDRNYNFD